MATPEPIIDVTHPGAPPPPPFTEWPEPAGDDWLAAMGAPEERTSVYVDSFGRRISLVHPDLIAPAAIVMREGVPAETVEFIWKGDE